MQLLRQYSFCNSWRRM